MVPEVTRLIDRDSLDDAAAAVETLLPDPAVRATLLRVLGEAISSAHEVNPASWSLTLSRTGDHIHFNVGPLLALRIAKSEIGMVLPETVSSGIAASAPGVSKTSPFDAVRGMAYVAGPHQGVLEAWKALESAHRSRNASPQIDSGSGHRAFSGSTKAPSLLSHRSFPRLGHARPGRGMPSV